MQQVESLSIALYQLRKNNINIIANHAKVPSGPIPSELPLMESQINSLAVQNFLYIYILFIAHHTSLHSPVFLQSMFWSP